MLKQFGLAFNNQEQFTYAKEITSVMTSDIELPANVHIIMTSKRGKGLYAKRDIAKGDLIWSEEPLFHSTLGKCELDENCFCMYLLWEIVATN